MAVAGRLLWSQTSPPAEDGQELGTAGLTGSCLSAFASVLCFGFFPLFSRAVIATAEELHKDVSAPTPCRSGHLALRAEACGLRTHYSA